MKRLLIITFICLAVLRISIKAQVKKESSHPGIVKGISAPKILDNYIKAIGGRENILKVKDRTTVMKGTAEGRAIKITIYQKMPNKMREIINTGMFIQSIYFNGKKGVMEVGGKTFDVKGIQLENLKYESSLHLLPDIDSMGIKLKYAGVDTVNGKQAYKVFLIFPSGVEWTQFYDPETWLKVKESKTVKTAQGTYTQDTYLSNYQDINGIKYPFSVKQTLGRQKMSFRVTMISVNDNLNDKLFEINY